MTANRPPGPRTKPGIALLGGQDDSPRRDAPVGKRWQGCRHAQPRRVRLGMSSARTPGRRRTLAASAARCGPTLSRSPVAPMQGSNGIRDPRVRTACQDTSGDRHMVIGTFGTTRACVREGGSASIADRLQPSSGGKTRASGPQVRADGAQLAWGGGSPSYFQQAGCLPRHGRAGAPLGGRGAPDVIPVGVRHRHQGSGCLRPRWRGRAQ
jgi:hypothetical protein